MLRVSSGDRMLDSRGQELIDLITRHDLVILNDHNSASTYIIPLLELAGYTLFYTTILMEAPSRTLRFGMIYLSVIIA